MMIAGEKFYAMSPTMKKHQEDHALRTLYTREVWKMKRLLTTSLRELREGRDYVQTRNATKKIGDHKQLEPS